jgi:hypothetical protein
MAVGDIGRDVSDLTEASRARTEGWKERPRSRPSLVVDV